METPVGRRVKSDLAKRWKSVADAMKCLLVSFMDMILHVNNDGEHDVVDR
jgi:predicted transcriptional regulator YheO